jgi:hypothetical protein
LADNEGLTGSFPSSNVSNVLWQLVLSIQECQFI